MKRLFLAALLSLAATCPSSVLAQVFFVYPDARVVGKGALVAGPYLGIGEDDLIRLAGYGRWGLASYLDVGAEVLVDNASSEWRGGAGVDVKFSLFSSAASLPFDLSANTGIGFLSGDGNRLIQVPVGGVISSEYETDGGRVFAPYLGVYVLFVDTRVDRGAQPDLTDTDVDVELRAGLRYVLNPETDLFGALQVGRNAVFYVGLNFKL